jgi:hypothetical protein
MFALTVSLLILINVGVTLAVVRRLNDLTARLDRAAIGGPAAAADPPPLPAVGSKVAPFQAMTTEGGALAADDLSGRRLVGFFAEGCGPCVEQVTRFVEYASVFPGGRGQVLAVVVAKPGTASPLSTRLASVARVIVESGAGPVTTAFRVDGFPAACLLADNVVIGAEVKLERLRLPRPEPAAPALEGLTA